MTWDIGPRPAAAAELIECLVHDSVLLAQGCEGLALHIRRPTTAVSSQVHGRGLGQFQELIVAVWLVGCGVKHDYTQTLNPTISPLARWVEGISSDGSSQLLLTGGAFTLAELTARQFLLAYRSPRFLREILNT